MKIKKLYTIDNNELVTTTFVLNEDVFEDLYLKLIELYGTFSPIQYTNYDVDELKFKIDVLYRKQSFIIKDKANIIPTIGIILKKFINDENIVLDELSIVDYINVILYEKKADREYLSLTEKEQNMSSDDIKDILNSILELMDVVQIEKESLIEYENIKIDPSLDCQIAVQELKKRYEILKIAKNNTLQIEWLIKNNNIIDNSIRKVLKISENV